METALLTYVILVFLFGITVGSFLNVCILRIPIKESVVTVPSHCLSCGKQLKWYELLPVFSWLVLRGKCRKCKRPVSAQYPVIEAVNGLLWVLIFLIFGLVPFTLLCCLMTSALLVLSVIDARTGEIPAGINIFILVLGVGRLALDYSSWSEYALGFVVVSVPLLLVLLITGGRGIGGGDIKLMAVCGLFLGWKLALLAFALGCILGAVIHLIRMRVSDAGRVLALGPYLAAGIFIAMLWGDQLLSWYFGFFA